MAGHVKSVGEKGFITGHAAVIDTPGIVGEGQKPICQQPNQRVVDGVN
jgi:hypothetical protein